MVHAIIIPPPEDRAKGSPLLYSRTWVRAAGFAKEEEAQGRARFEGMMCAPRGWPVLRAMFLNYVRFGQAVKDTANTALSYHGGAKTATPRCASSVAVASCATAKQPHARFICWDLL